MGALVEARAQFDGPERAINTRVAEHAGHGGEARDTRARNDMRTEINFIDDDMINYRQLNQGACSASPWGCKNQVCVFLPYDQRVIKLVQISY